MTPTKNQLENLMNNHPWGASKLFLGSKKRGMTVHKFKVIPVIKTELEPQYIEVISKESDKYRECKKVFDSSNPELKYDELIYYRDMRV